MKENKKVIRMAKKLLCEFPLHRIRPEYLKRNYKKTFEVLRKANKHYEMISRLKGD